jgi:hypothetical protein
MGGHRGGHMGGHRGSRRGGHGSMRLNHGHHRQYEDIQPRYPRRWWNSWYRQNPVYYYDEVAPEVYMYPTYEIAKPTPRPRSFYEDFVNFIRWVFGYPPI